MSMSTRAGAVLSISVIVGACSSGTPLDLGDQTPPAVIVSTAVTRDTVELQSFASDVDGVITSHRLLLNGVVIRQGTANQFVVIDSVLPARSYTLVADATSEGGTQTTTKYFQVLEYLPPVAPSQTFQVAEADSFSVNLRNITSGEATRTFNVPNAPGLIVERFGVVIRVSAAGNATTPPEDFVGNLTLPYEVTDINGTATGTLTFEFTPQPDIVVTEVVDVMGTPLPFLRKRLSLNGVSQEYGLGTRAQGIAGSNIWGMWAQVSGSYLGLVVPGQPFEVPLNLNLLVDTMTLGSADIAIKLVMFTGDLSLGIANCSNVLHYMYPGMLADTTTVIRFIVHTQGAVDRPGVSGASYLVWRAAFDSLVADEQQEALMMGRPPRTLIFTTDVETPPVLVTTPTYPAGRPAAGQVWVYDSILPGHHPRWFGGRNFISEAGDIVSAIAWSSSVAEVSRRQLALARWHDRTFGRSWQGSVCTRHNPPVDAGTLSGGRTWWEANVLPQLHRRADLQLRMNGKGYLMYNNAPPVMP